MTRLYFSSIFPYICSQSGQVISLPLIRSQQMDWILPMNLKVLTMSSFYSKYLVFNTQSACSSRKYEAWMALSKMLIEQLTKSVTFVLYCPLFNDKNGKWSFFSQHFHVGALFNKVTKKSEQIIFGWGLGSSLRVGLILVQNNRKNHYKWLVKLKM